MKKITSKSRISVVIEIVTAMLRVYDSLESLGEDSYLKTLVEKIRKDTNIIIESTRADKIASELEKIDRERDETVRCLSKILEGWAVMPDERSEKAKILLDIFKKFGSKIATAPYAQESLLVKSLISDMGAEQCQDALKTLDGVKHYLDALEDVQKRFDKASDEFRDAKITKGISPTEAKRTLLTLFNGEFCTYLSAMASSKGGDYKALSEKIDAEIDKAK